MEDNNKHNIFSKEEFFKLIDEKKSLPSDADDFDKEAMEGLAMVKDRKKLAKLDESIDEILRKEAKKAGRKRNIYYFAAAASLLLIIGLFFLVKENTLKKEEKNLAVNAPQATEDIVNKVQPDEAAQKPMEEPTDKQVTTGESAETKGKESLKTAKLEEENAKSETFASDVTTVAVPTPETENKIVANEKANNVTATGTGVSVTSKMAEGKAGGKSAMDEVTLLDQEQQRAAKRELSKKGEEEKKKMYKEAGEKDKSRYETNTVWTTPSTSINNEASDDLKQQQTKTKAKPQVNDDNRNMTSTVTSSNAAPVQSQQEGLAKSGKDEDMTKADGPAKNAEVMISEQKVSGNTSGKHRKKFRKVKAAPAAPKENQKDVAGYSYYSQSSTRDFNSPEFMGGVSALQQFIGDNLEISAPEKKGTIVVEFTVRNDGSVDTSNIKIVQPIKNCDPCSRDVKSLVKKMPKWQPAQENGKGKEYRQKVSVPYEGKQSKK